MLLSPPCCSGKNQLIFVCMAHLLYTCKVRGKVSSDNCFTNWQPASTGSKFQPRNVLCEFSMESFVLCCVSQHSFLHSFYVLFQRRYFTYLNVRASWQRLLISCYLSDNNDAQLVNSPVGVPSKMDDHMYFWDVLLKR